MKQNSDLLITHNFYLPQKRPIISSHAYKFIAIDYNTPSSMKDTHRSGY